MYRIAICDSSKTQGEYMQKQCQEILALHQITAEIQFFYDPLIFVNECSKQYFHIVILDIDKRISSGLNIAKQLRKMQFHQHIVFISDYEEFMEQAYDLHAFQYLLKPINVHKLERTLLDGYAAQKSFDVLTIHKREQFYRIPFQDIIFIESDRVYLQIHMNDDIIRYRAKLDDLLKLLQHHHFIRCHQSFIINLSKVKYMERYQVLTMDNTIIPISKTYTKDVRDQFLKLYQKTIL